MKRTLLFLLLFSVSVSVSFSQSIKIKGVSPTYCCINDSVTVSFETNGNFNENNVFSLQLSNPDGSFENFVNLGSVAGKNSGKIVGKFPKNLPEGTKYRMRIFSSNPIIISNINEEDITLILAVSSKDIFGINPQKIRNYSSNFSFDIDYPISLFTTDSVNFQNIKWTLEPDAYSNEYFGYNPTDIYFKTDGKKTVNYEYISANSCVENKKGKFDILVYENCKAVIPADAKVLKGDYASLLPDEDRKINYFWAMPGSNCNFSTTSLVSSIIYMETGSTFTITAATNCIFYLKPGAVLNISNLLNVIIHKSTLSSINDVTNYIDSLVQKCDNVEFNYDEAPKNGIQILIDMGYLTSVNGQNNTDTEVTQSSDGNFLRFNSKSNSNLECKVEIVDYLGRILYNNPNSDFSDIDISSYNQGVYFIIITNQQGIYKKKIVKL